MAVAWIKSLFQTKNHDEYTRPPSSTHTAPDLFTPVSHTITPEPVVQTDVRAKKIRMRVRRSIDKQLKQTHQYAQKPHGAECPDIFFCKRNPCFRREPDKIVSKSYGIEKQ